jgi:hypothetical protein
VRKSHSTLTQSTNLASCHSGLGNLGGEEEEEEEDKRHMLNGAGGGDRFLTKRGLGQDNDGLLIKENAGGWMNEKGENNIQL